MINMPFNKNFINKSVLKIKFILKIIIICLKVNNFLIIKIVKIIFLVNNNNNKIKKVSNYSLTFKKVIYQTKQITLLNLVI